MYEIIEINGKKYARGLLGYYEVDENGHIRFDKGPVQLPNSTTPSPKPKPNPQPPAPKPESKPQESSHPSSYTHSSRSSSTSSTKSPPRQNKIKKINNLSSEELEHIINSMFASAGLEGAKIEKVWKTGKGLNGEQITTLIVRDKKKNIPHVVNVITKKNGETIIDWGYGFSSVVLHGKSIKKGSDNITETLHSTFYKVDPNKSIPVHYKFAADYKITKQRIDKKEFLQKLNEELEKQNLSNKVLRISASPDPSNPLAYQYKIKLKVKELNIPNNLPRLAKQKYLSLLRKELDKLSNNKVKYSLEYKNGKYIITATISDSLEAYSLSYNLNSNLKNIEVPLPKEYLSIMNDVPTIKNKYKQHLDYDKLKASSKEELNKTLESLSKDIEEAFAYKTLNEIRRKNPEYYKLLIQFLDLGSDNRLSIKELNKAIQDTNRFIRAQGEFTRVPSAKDEANKSDMFIEKGIRYLTYKTQEYIHKALDKFGADESVHNFAAGLVEGFYGALGFVPMTIEAIARDIYNKKIHYTKEIADSLIEFVKRYYNKIKKANLNSYDVGLLIGSAIGSKVSDLAIEKGVKEIRELPIKNAISEVLSVYDQYGIKGVELKLKETLSKLNSLYKEDSMPLLMSFAGGIDYFVLKKIAKALGITIEEAKRLIEEGIIKLDKVLRIVEDEKLKKDIIKEIFKNAKDEQGKFSKEFIDDVHNALKPLDDVYVELKDIKSNIKKELKEKLDKLSKLDNKDIVKTILEDAQLKSLFDNLVNKLFEVRKNLDKLVEKYGESGLKVRALIMQELFKSLMGDPYGRILGLYLLYRLYDIAKQKIELLRPEATTQLVTTREQTLTILKPQSKPSSISMLTIPRTLIRQKRPQAKPIILKTTLRLVKNNDRIEVYSERLGLLATIPITQFKIKLGTLYKVIIGNLIKTKISSVELQKLLNLIAQNLVIPEIAHPRLTLVVPKIEIPNITTLAVPKVNLSVKGVSVDNFKFNKSKEDKYARSRKKKKKKLLYGSRGKLITKFYY